MKHRVEKTEAAIDYIEGHLSEMLNLELGAMACLLYTSWMEALQESSFGYWPNSNIQHIKSIFVQKKR